MDIGKLNSFLRGELAATETYQQALDKLKKDGDISWSTSLGQIHQEHRTAANTWREHIHAFGGKPDQSSGAWGMFAKATEGAAKLFGAKAAIKALKEGEESGLKSYEAALGNPDVPNECQTLIQSTLAPQTRQHIAELDRLLGS